ncbi:16891_t:CDS:2, partial [Gigaspora rosea]
ISSSDDDFGLQIFRTQQSEILAMNDIEDNVFINFNTSEISEHEFENKEWLEIFLYLDEQYSKLDMSLRSLLLIIYQNRRAISTFNFIPDLNLMHQNSNILYNVSKVLKSRHAYGVTNCLCKKAISAGFIVMETLNKLLKNFIHKYSLSYLFDNIVSNNTSREIQKNESDVLEESSEENLEENQKNIDPFAVHDTIIKK